MFLWIRPGLSLAVLSSSFAKSFSSSASSDADFVAFDTVNELALSPGDMARVESGGGRRRMLPVWALWLSPVEPLPVELVAGGDGRPDEPETEVGLSGGGEISGMLISFGGNEPRNIADKGRREVDREVITTNKTGHQPRQTVLENQTWLSSNTMK